jgi:hypothetical protein
MALSALSRIDYIEKLRIQIELMDFLRNSMIDAYNRRIDQGASGFQLGHEFVKSFGIEMKTRTDELIRQRTQLLEKEIADPSPDVRHQVDLLNAVDAVLGDALSRVDVHPCDEGNVEIRVKALLPEYQALYRARQAYKSGE